MVSAAVDPRVSRPLETLETVKGRGVMEGSTQRAVPRVEESHLEVFCPVGIRRQDTEGLGELKAEAAVVAGIAKEHDSRLLQCVGSREDTVHQGLSDATTLVGRQHAQRPQSNQRTPVDAGAAAHDVSDHFFVDQSDEREGRDYIAVVAKGANEFRFGHIASVGAGERRCVDSEDSCMVIWPLSTQDHEPSLASAAMRAKRVLAGCDLWPSRPHGQWSGCAAFASPRLLTESAAVLAASGIAHSPAPPGCTQLPSARDLGALDRRRAGHCAANRV